MGASELAYGAAVKAGFDTARLSLRDWQPVLAAPASRAILESDLQKILTPPVLRSLPEPLQLASRHETAHWVNARAQESDVLLVRQKGNGALTGLVIMASLAEPGAKAADLHLGYLLGEGFWGLGYASEIIQGLVAALKALPPNERPTRILGGVALDNPASARVLQKAGFVRAGQQPEDETQMFVFEMSAPTH